MDFKNAYHKLTINNKNMIVNELRRLYEKQYKNRNNFKRPAPAGYGAHAV